jgi:hypothetical protein
MAHRFTRGAAPFYSLAPRGNSLARAEAACDAFVAQCKPASQHTHNYKFNLKNYIVEMSMILNLSLKAVCNECLFFDLIFKHQTLYIKVLIKIIYFEFLKRPYFNSDIGNVYLNFQENLKN